MRPGTRIRVRPLVVWGLPLLALGVAAVLAGGIAANGLRPGPGPLVVLVLLPLGFVVLPLWLWHHLRRWVVVVTDTGIGSWLGGRLTREVRFSDLTEIRLVIVRRGFRRPAVPTLWLDHPLPDARPGALIVNPRVLRTIDPVLLALEPYLAARPELVRDGRQRAELEHAIAARLRAGTTP